MPPASISNAACNMVLGSKNSAIKPPITRDIALQNASRDSMALATAKVTPIWVKCETEKLFTVVPTSNTLV